MEARHAPITALVLAVTVGACGRLGYDAPAGGDGGVVHDADLGDGPRAGADAIASGTCPALCTGGCPAGVCTILEPLAAVECPPGMPCEVVCALDNSCAVPIHCGDASSCKVTCSGARSCDQAIDCDNAACELICSGDRACLRVRCDSAPSCHVQCGGPSSCNFSTECGTGPCNFVCDGASSCAAGVRCESACACDATCPPEGCPMTPWAFACPVGCSNPDGSCTSAGGCDRCP